MAKSLDNRIREAARLSGVVAQSSGTAIDRVTAELLSALVKLRAAEQRGSEQTDRWLRESVQHHMRWMQKRLKLIHTEHGRPWLSVAEIADAWRCSKPTARKYLGRARVLQRRGNKDVVSRDDWAELVKAERRNAARRKRRLLAKTLHLQSTNGKNRKTSR